MFAAVRRPISRDFLQGKDASHDGQYNGKLLFIVLSTFFPRRKKVAKNRRSGQNLRFSPRPQLPRDARSPPIREGDCNSVSCVSQRRQPTPAAERLGAHTAPVDRWEVGLTEPNISSNIEAIALTFRDKLLYGKKLRFCKKLSSALSFFVKNQYPVSVRCQNCGFTDAARTRLRFDQQEIFKRLFDEPQGAPPQGRAVGVG